MTSVVSCTARKQLCMDLSIEDGEKISNTSQSDGLPGQPSVSLDYVEVLNYVRAEFTTPILDMMGPYLWLLASPNSSHVSALHDQIVRGRQIIISENPELHLVWVDSRIYIKPLPPYLLSYEFWEYYIGNAHDPAKDELRVQLAEAALGFLRTWCFLVKHQSDYDLAVSHRLIPHHVSYEAFLSFLGDLKTITNAQVSMRYHYGELRLTRLNFWIRILFLKPFFHKVTWRYADYFARYYAPILFIFGAFSVTLSAMQVGVGARDDWVKFKAVSAWFAVLVMI